MRMATLIKKDQDVDFTLGLIGGNISTTYEAAFVGKINAATIPPISPNK